MLTNLIRNNRKENSDTDCCTETITTPNHFLRFVGNSWGCDDASCCVGCGNQEEFYGCADVRIVPSGQGGVQASSSGSAAEITTTTTTTTTTTAAPTSSGGTCRGAGAYEFDPGMSQWCVINCAAGFCPPSHCICDWGIGSWNFKTWWTVLAVSLSPLSQGLTLSQYLFCLWHHCSCWKLLLFRN